MQSPTSSSNNSDAFNTYYQEFASILKQLESPSSVDNTAAAASSTAAASASSLHQQCLDLLSLMTLEARGTDCPDTKFERLERTKIYKFQLEAVHQQHDRDFLMGGTAARMLQMERERQQVHSILDRNETRAAQQNELLERAHRSVQETEEVGQELMQEMQRNRGTIESAQGHVDGLNSMTERASKLVKTLSKPWWMPRR